jgi:hypothetical protein
MKWIDISGGNGGHRGEYDWKCDACGGQDWFASYTDPNKERVPCKHCGKKPVKAKEAKDEYVDVMLRIPKEVEDDLLTIAKLAGVTMEQVVLVALAREIYRGKK